MNRTSMQGKLWRRTTRTLGVLAVLVMLLALGVSVSMAQGDAPTGVDAPLGKSSIGDTVFNDFNVDGDEDSGETGIPNVKVHLYKDQNGNGTLEASDYLSPTTTNNAGYYDFQVDGDEKYWVVLDPTNFDPGGALEDYIFTSGATIGGVPTPLGIAYYKEMPLNQLDFNDADFGLVKVDLRISLSPGAATNITRDPHVFTATVQSKIGNGTWTNVSGATPTVTYTPVPGTPGTSPVNCGPTNANGQCTVTINSNTPGVFTASATVTTNVIVNIPADAFGTLTPTPISRTRTTGGTNNTAANGSGPAKKTYVDLRIKLNPLTPVNEVGDPHTFTATVEQNTGTGGWTVVNNATVNFSLLNNTATPAATITSASSCNTNSSGQCTVTILGTKAGSVDVHAKTTVTVGGLSITRDTETAANTNAGGTNDATKTYADLRIKLNPLTPVNEVGDPHTFTATVEQNKGDGTGWQNVPNNTTVSFTILGTSTANGSFTGGSTCQTTNGSCNIEITGTQAGVVNLQADVSVTVNTVAITRVTNTTANTNAGGTVNAKKTYADLRIKLNPLTPVNKVGDPHTFTATVEQNKGDGTGWQNVPNNTTVSFTILGTSTANGSFTGGSTCQTTNGSCNIQITGTQAGVVDLQASANVTVNTVAITRTTSTTANTNAGGTVNAKKTYADLRIKLNPLTPVNEVGDPHTFTATVEQNKGDGTGWQNVPNNTTVSFTILGTSTANGSFTGGSTCQTTNGSCNIEITGTQAGVVNLQADVSVTVNTVAITRITGTTANTNAGGTVNAKKTYADLRIQIGPPTAINSVNDHTPLPSQ